MREGLKFPPLPAQIRTLTDPSPSDDLRLHRDEIYRIEVGNQGDEAVYIAVILLQSDGQMKPIFLLPRTNTENSLLARGAKPLRVPVGAYVQVTPPFGADLIKVMLTKTWVPFARLAAAPGNAETAEEIAVRWQELEKS
jgi:hypothetical protein